MQEIDKINLWCFQSLCLFTNYLFKKKTLIEEKSKEILLLTYAYVSAHSYLYKKELHGFKTLKEKS